MRVREATIAVWIVITMFAGARQVDAEPPPTTKAPGEDEAVYSCKQRSDSVVVTFKSETEVKDLITWVVGFTCKSFMLDPRIVSTGRKVSIITPNKMTPAEAYHVFLGALATIGLTVVPRGNVLRIVEAQMAHKEAMPLLRHGTPDDVEELVRYVYKPSYVAADALRQAWQSLKTDAGDVFVLGSVVVAADYASHVRDMLAFARLVDVPGGSDAIYTIPVHHADATKLNEKLTGILGLTASPAPRPEAAAVPSKIMVDERTNTLIVAASEAGYERVKALVDRLDIALEVEGGNSIHVYPLGSAIADELAKTLTTAIGDGKQQAQRPGAGTTPTAPIATPPTATPAAAPAASPLDGLGSVLEGQVRVIADPPTNSLIVIASGRDYLAIKDVIRQLDLPRRQVYIEAMIFEVDLDDARDLGSAFHGLSPLGSGANSPVVIGSSQNDVNSISLKNVLTSSTGLNGLVAGVVSPATNLLGLSIPSYAALFRALATANHSNILSEPSIIAVDNVEAKYKVGVTIPVGDGQQSFVSTASATASPITSTHFTEQELPLTLNIKPHISNNDLILLEVTHEAKELISGTQSANGASWSTRSFETRVVVRDQQTVVLGGLTQDSVSEAATQVPFLGSIPLLGYLFKSTHKEHHKTNLLVMLTPHIIKDQLDLQAIQDRKLREHDEMLSAISTLDHMRYEPKIDYRRKRGLLEEINRSLLDVERDLVERGAILAPRGVEAGAVTAPPPPAP